MDAKIAILILGLIAQVYGACINCGFGPGRDTCRGSRCSPMIVRPNKLPKVDITELCKPRVICKQVAGFQPLKPIGDVCSCNRAIVTPAFIPKPACALCAKPVCGSSASSSSSAYESGSSGYSNAFSGSHAYSGSSGFGYTSSGSGSGYSGSGSGYSGSGSGYSGSGSGSSAQYITESAAPSYETIISTSGSSSSGSSAINTCDETTTINHAYKPADAVSLSLAYKLQNEMNNIAEDKLFFGFTKMPREIQIVKKPKNTIAEENLFTHNGQVVELKHMIVGNGKSIDEEAAETLMDEELNEDVDTGAHGSGVATLTYGQIGFGPARVKEVPYVAVTGDGIEAVATSSSSSGQACNDGYVSGKVMMSPVRRAEVYVQNRPVSYDDDYEEESSGAVSYPAFSYSSSSSSSNACSSSSQSASKIRFEKLGCGDD